MSRSTGKSLDITWLVRPETANRRKPGSRGVDISRCSEIWLGVRGVNYYSFAVSRNYWMTEAVLVPERDNPHDLTAVAVHVGHNLIGYLPRTMASILYTQLGILRNRGHSCKVPVLIDRDEDVDQWSAWVCVPTMKGINKLVSRVDLVKEFMHIWTSLDPEVRETIERDGFHLSATTGPLLWAAGGRSPNFWLSRKFDKDDVDVGVTISLQTLRERRNRKREKDRQRRNQAILADYEAGITKAEIGRRHGVSPSTVSVVVKASAD
jgi:hypothetical protein